MYIAIMGYGVVGSGVAEVINKNHDSIVRKSTQSELEIKYILDLKDFPGDPNEKLFIKDFNIILNDPEVKVVVETMGGLHPSLSPPASRRARASSPRIKSLSPPRAASC